MLPQMRASSRARYTLAPVTDSPPRGNLKNARLASSLRPQASRISLIAACVERGNCRAMTAAA